MKKLLDDRDAPSKMLLQVAQLIPDQVWLTGLVVNDEAVKISGQTPGYNDVSDFIKNLNGTSQFTDIGAERNSGAGHWRPERPENPDLRAYREAAEGGRVMENLIKILSRLPILPLAFAYGMYMYYDYYDWQTNWPTSEPRSQEGSGRDREVRHRWPQ